MTTFIRKLALITIFIALTFISFGQELERKYLSNKTYTFQELTDAYKSLAKQSKHAQLISMGKTDNGADIQVFVIGNANSGPVGPYDTGGLGILVMNGIHAGESCGVDASLHWADKILQDIESIGDATIYIIPAYNIGGTQNRSCCTRANQNGPEDMGFRGNANNLDLNRDFMKMDAENTLTFRAIMTAFDPDIFVDTHSTNGADYQYSMTLIPYQSERWPTDLGNLNHAWYESVYDECNKSYKTQHYVNVWGRTPETGFSAFQTTSVYSTGYAGLNRTIGLTTEAHMFKPYEERVEATMATLDAVLNASIEMEKDIKIARERALAADMHLAGSKYPVEWELDSSVVEEIDFEGYKADFFTSELTGQQRYRYDQENPETFRVKYYPKYKIKKVADIPKYYILRKGQHKAIANIMAAGVQFEPLEEDMDLSVMVHYVKSIEYANRPYEGHFPHKSFETEEVEITAHFKAGDIKIPVNQRATRIIIEALEPHAPGSFFRWNYFDTYLQQKEWFSAYIFEEKAIAFLEENPMIKAEFETWRETTEGVENNAFVQLFWIYKKTPYYEKEHMMIPVFRIY